MYMENTEIIWFLYVWLNKTIVCFMDKIDIYEKVKNFGRKTNSGEYVGFVPIAVLERKNTG